MKLRAPLEVGIAVRDLPRMLDFYVRVLGCKKISEIAVPADKTRLNGLAPDGCTIARLETSYGERIKLLAATSTMPARSGQWLLERAGLAYLTFIIDDIDGYRARLAAHGVDLASEKPIENRPGLRVLFFKDPEDNALELVEYADLASYRPDLVKR